MRKVGLPRLQRPVRTVGCPASRDERNKLRSVIGAAVIAEQLQSLHLKYPEPDLSGVVIK